MVTDAAPTYPRVLDELVPAAWHHVEQYENNRIEADHGRLKHRPRPMRGLRTDPAGPFSTGRRARRRPLGWSRSSSRSTVIFGAAVLVFLFVTQWRFPSVPTPLLAVLLAAGVTVAFNLQQHGIKVVGPVPAGLPRPDLPGRHTPTIGRLVVRLWLVTAIACSPSA